MTDTPSESRQAEKCGTYAGWNAHKYRGEPPCGPCKHAQTTYKRAWRKRGRCADGLGWPLAQNAPYTPEET